MQNFPFEHDGKELWYSRSLAVSLVCFSAKVDENDRLHIYVLANQRGKGCEFNRFKWNIPGGFIDFNENAEQCAIRETFEETGVVIPKGSVLRMHSFDTEPNSGRQTMIASYFTYIDHDTAQSQFTTEHSEPDEVNYIKWIDLTEIDNYHWTRNQKEFIRKAYTLFRCTAPEFKKMLNDLRSCSEEEFVLLEKIFPEEKKLFDNYIKALAEEK